MHSNLTGVVHCQNVTKNTTSLIFVICGIEECCKGTPKYERLKHDLKEVTYITTNTVSSISPLSILDHTRIGKYREHSKRPRPVLVKSSRATDRSCCYQT